MENRLKVYRNKQNLTQKQMAAMCNISERQYIRYENSHQEPTVSIAIKMAKTLKVTVEELFPEQDGFATPCGKRKRNGEKPND